MGWFATHFVWAIDHVLWGNRFLELLGDLWYRLWMTTPIQQPCIPCVFCVKEYRMEEIERGEVYRW